MGFSKLDAEQILPSSILESKPCQSFILHADGGSWVSYNHLKCWPFCQRQHLSLQSEERIGRAEAQGLRSESPKLGQGQRGGHDAPWVLSAMTPQLTSSSDSMGSLFPVPRFEHLQVPPQSPKETFKGTLSFPLMLSSGTVISRPNGDKENQSPRKPSMVSAPGFCPA